MKTRTEQEMMALIMRFAQNDSRIRAVLMNGSRVNPTIKGDIFQDYDIVNLVTDVEPFKDENYITTHFGETIITQTPEDKLDPPPVGDGSYNYNMQFLAGNRIDLSFCDVKTIPEQIKDSLTIVLLDKDQVVPPLPAPSESSYMIEAPTEQLYDDCCDEFIFGLGSHIPKTIWRKELPLLKVYIDVVLRTPLIKMFAWEVGIKTNFEKSIGKSGKYLQKYLDPEVWQAFEKTYADANYDNLWSSLFIFYDLFKESAEFVGQTYGFQFPEEKSIRALKFLKHVQQLPPDAKSIY